MSGHSVDRGITMSLYLVRAGSNGELEDNFLHDNRV